ncbi:MAG: putative 4-hydroxybenzoate polyprenyltransferase [Deltaproteobacteria bacterium]|jgi:4-hydroxybenzoate polyprenyltransferase|nr:putative 4-hydroxybenzoate polyprenyltransferase [Deltaproteobacteria bacterium]MCW8891824.1 putative 4-hydroxybenzoate polyprenyltransferase [Deltaproteobacteria bacterium]MCW9049244.1 putative 4-hydroxybenzoate polyprenyltransferase [Deltaproteobacteria bacterium]
MDKGQVFDKIKTLLEMIKFSHTVFAFPFALMGVVLASLASGKAPGFGQVFWICVAMVGARTAAMGLNRLIDARIDADNPRTADRHIPAGKVSIMEAVLFVLAALILFFFAAWMLNPLCFKLAPIVVGFFVLYAYCKRFTHFAHLVLGICLAAAPIGAWVALRGDLGWPVLSLGVAVLFWVSGFDIFYALQDYEFDVEHGLHSVPSRLGKEKSFLLVRIFHGLMLFFLLLVLPGSGLGWIYFTGVIVVACLLVYEHLLVKPDDLSKLDAAFFNMNGYISITIFAFTLVDAIV